MIDGIRFRAFVDAPERVADRLERPRIVPPDEPGGLPSVTGFLGSLRARVHADELHVRGSLPTYMGETAPLTRTGVADARARLEEALGADLGDAHVWGLELTADLVLPRPVGVYLPLLVRRPRFKRDVFGTETVRFRTEARWQSFYDKAAECRKRKKPAPCGHVLRLELKFHKRLAKQLKLAGPLTLADLGTRPCWRRLVARWLTEYEAVVKARAPLPFDALGDLHRALQFAGLHAVGMATVEASIRAEVDAGRIGRSTGHDRRKWARALAADPAYTVEDERVAELDAAVRAAAARALAD